MYLSKYQYKVRKIPLIIMSRWCKSIGDFFFCLNQENQKIHFLKKVFQKSELSEYNKLT